MRCILLISCLFFGSELFAQTVILVRHAEKMEPWQPEVLEDAWQPLSEKGIQRSRQLSLFFNSVSLKAVYASKTVRAISTALPSATAHGLLVNIHPACSDVSYLQNWVETELKRYGPSDTILVVSHSNIIPGWLIQLGVNSEYLFDMGISHSSSYGNNLVTGYDGIWMLVFTEEGGKPYVRFARMAS